MNEVVDVLSVVRAAQKRAGAVDKHGYSSVLAEAAREIESLREQVAEMRNRKDAAYLERNRLVAALAWLYPSGTKRTAIEEWHPAWHGCVYIDTPAGQLSWHYHDSHEFLFADLPPYKGEWDGHATDQKYERLAAAAQQLRHHDTPAWQANERLNTRVEKLRAELEATSSVVGRSDGVIL